jgi:hypothetical protein
MSNRKRAAARMNRTTQSPHDNPSGSIVCGEKLIPSKGETMRFILGVLWGYYIRVRKRLLIITLAVFIVLVLMCAVVLPAIALSMLGLSVMRERASRPPQTSVPSLVGLNYETAQTKVRDSNLNIRVLAHRYDVSNEPCTIIFQTPQTGERVSYGTFVGVVVSNRDGDKAKPCSSH